MSDRITIEAGDFFTSQLSQNADVVLLANVVHIFSPARNLRLLGLLREFAAVGTRLLLVDFWTDDSHAQPVFAAIMAVVILAAAVRMLFSNKIEAQAIAISDPTRIIGGSAIGLATGLMGGLLGIGGGVFIVELAPHQAQPMADRARSIGFDVAVRTDLAGRDRALVARA